jgi:class 3 adenylate cyclase
MSDPIAVRRKLVAVFAAYVEGYSRLMGADEVGTLKGLTERRAILDRFIGEHRGRIANTAGDSVLAEFGSAVDAVQCAVEAQTALGIELRRLALMLLLAIPQGARPAREKARQIVENLLLPAIDFREGLS